MIHGARALSTLGDLLVTLSHDNANIQIKESNAKVAKVIPALSEARQKSLTALVTATDKVDH